MSWLSEVPRLAERPLGGLAGGAGPYALAQLERAWIVVPTREDADRWVRALRFFQVGRADAPAVLPYPADDGRPWDGVSPAVELPRQRIAARHAWEAGQRALIVAPAKALLLRVPVELESRRIRRGKPADRRALLDWLGAWGWLSTQRVEEPGTFSVRGGVLDAWSPQAERPVRIEWFDEDVETIKAFDPEGRRPATSLPDALFLPAREARLDAASAERAAAYLHAVATERGVVGQDRRRVLADLRNGVWFPGAEDYGPALTPLGPPVVGAPLYVVEPDAVTAELARFEAKCATRFAALEPEERPLVRPEDRYSPARAAPLTRAIPVTALAHGDGADFGTKDNRALRVGANDLAPVAKQLARLAAEGRAVTLVAESGPRAERLRAILEPHGLLPGTGRASPGHLSVELGDLPAGFVADDLAFVTVEELFGERLGGPPPAATTFRRASIASFSGVRLGDLVVHARHGIGRYGGLSRMPLGEVAGDFVQVTYRDGEKLYVPVHRLDLLTPYRSVGEGELPKLDRLGGVTWEARRAKVRDAVLALAHDLLRLYARRQLVAAHAYGDPSALFDQFAETFPYVETPDQEAAIADCLDDLAQEEPMERLLVGDVGFGKTEVALRAAFKVVDGGGQVAVLCPTTVLAFQHHGTFRRRLEGFPVRVEVLSRFQGAAESAAILADVAAGKVDILIGTTRMLGRAVRFKELGLVVVDEEHRFGVKQKEQLKKLATGAHVLAMSATPIPRTLQMALGGIRKLSVIATPPVGRHAIRTEIVRFSPDRVREDVLHELRRGGQVFFIHNRVQSIAGVARWLETVVPEATIGVVHGQMPDDQLERALVDFVRGKTNVLVSTTIVESGIDIPSVNTMLVNRADTFGLAQLYQLRGRIGRGNARAHCTLLVGGAGSLRKEAMQRLRALQENTELGSGFAIASADLELRGGGEILGDRQHGQIAAIGFDAYLELLEEAVGRARGETARQQLDPEVEVPVSAWIPEDYVPETGERLATYQQLALARSREEIRREMDAMEARWGAPPPEAVNLGWLAGVRLSCKQLGLARLSFLKVRIVAELAERHDVHPRTLARLLDEEKGRFRRLGERSFEMRFTPEEAAHPFRVAEWMLARLAERPANPPRRG